MKKIKISLQDIAELSGVTKMTVSRYLRTPEKVSHTTGLRIAKVIDDVNYIPNRAPGILLNAQSNTIGVLVPSLQNQIFTDILTGIESVTSNNSYQPLIANFNYDNRLEESIIENLLSYNIDGIILTEKKHSLRAAKLLRSAGIPIIEIMDTCGDCLDMMVGFDNFQAAYDMVNNMLKKRKHSKIVYFGAKDDFRDEQRYLGYRKAMLECNMPSFRINPKSVSSISLGSILMRESLATHPDLDGIFCANDDIALGVMLYCQQHNIPVPEKISVAGFHGLDMSRQVFPNMATVITPRFDIGRLATSMLINKIKEDAINYSVIDVGYQIFEGNTI